MPQYSKLISSKEPGLILILVDQSGSMSDLYEMDVTKADFAAQAVNDVIEEIIKACSSGDRIKDRCFVGVIGYGETVNISFLEKVSDLAKNSNIVTINKKVTRAFVTSTANGGTPMAEAFQQAYIGVEKFISSHPNSFPPIVINITDGEPNDFDSTAIEAKKLTQLKTTDGNVIVLNAHISSEQGEIRLPNTNDAFSGNKFASFLFEISSILPDILSESAKRSGFDSKPGCRGFVFNAKPETLIGLLNFGTRPR